MRTKRSQRRAFAYALAYLRCPSCNRMGLGGGMQAAYCGRCGWAGTARVTFTQQPTRSGFRVVAHVEGFGPEGEQQS